MQYGHERNMATHAMCHCKQASCQSMRDGAVSVIYVVMAYEGMAYIAMA